MTDAGWAEKKMAEKVTGYHWNGRIRKSTVILPSIAAKLLKAEHARSVRIVKAEIKRVKLSQNEFTPTQKMRVEETLDRLLAALQRGRE